VSNSPVNTWIRRAAGRAPAPPLEYERLVGDILGAGRSKPVPGVMPRPRLDSMETSNRLRRAMAIVRTGVVPQGLDPFDE
jgi:hypothetical protein